MTIQLRPISMADVPAIAKVMAAAEAVDDTGEHYNEADLNEELSNPDIDLEQDVIGAFDDDELVGYCSTMARKDDSDRKTYVFGVTTPDRRGEGIGTMLAQAMMARAEQLQVASGAPMRVLGNGLSTNEDQAALFADFGFSPERWSFGMRITLGNVPPAPPLPEGYAVRVYTDADGERARLAHNIAFIDHPNFSVWDESEWKQWVTDSRNFRPALSFIVHPEGRPDDIAAYVHTNEYDAYQEVTGRREAYVAKVGTLPDHRGKGLATLLLKHCLVEYQKEGYDEAALDVDSENPTGALGIYERAGFSVERRYANYARTLG